MEEKELNYEEGFQLIRSMISRARVSYHSTGIGAMMWGIVIAVCSIVSFLQLQYDFKLPFDIFLLALLAIIPQILISRKVNREKKIKAHEDRFIDFLWMAFGICIFLLIHSINLVFYNWEPVANEYTVLAGHKPAFRFGEFTSCFFLILYGLPTFVTGAACRFKPMLWGGIICWVCAIITAYTPVKIDLLLTAFSAIVAWFIPGLIMEKVYRLAKKEAALNV